MLEFAKQTYGTAGIEDAWEEFFLWEDEDVEDPDPDNAHSPVFLPWMLHLWSPDAQDTRVPDSGLHGVPPTRAYLDRHGARLDPATRRYLEACLDAPYSFHEIIECDPGRGFRTRDLITGEEADVLEQSGSMSLSRGDVLFASLVRCDGIVVMEGVAPAVISPGHKIPILEFRRKITKDRDLSSAELLREWDAELRALYLQIMEPILNPPIPELQNTDGEAISLQTLVFDIDSAQQAFDALKHLAMGASDEELLADARRAADGSLRKIEFPWSKAGNRVHKSWDNTTLGSIAIDGKRLSVHVNSDRRAAKFKAIISKKLGESARYRATELVSAQHAMEEARMAGPELAPSMDHDELAEIPEVKAQLTAMLRQHYENWVSQRIPALDGKTPLQAVKTPLGREKVDALVSQIERDGARMKPPLDESIIRQLRERLGLGCVS